MVRRLSPSCKWSFNSTSNGRNPNFDFFNYCGITRPVKIYTTPETYINDITVTADIDFTKEEPSAVLISNVPSDPSVSESFVPSSSNNSTLHVMFCNFFL